MYHLHSKWKCPWCHVSDFNIGDFTIPCWPFRNHQQWKEIAEELKRMSSTTAKSRASHNGGVAGAPIFDFDLYHIIPCMLHLTMAVVKKLLRLTARETGQQIVALRGYANSILVHNQKLQKKWEGVFTSLGIRLYSDAKQTLEYRIKKSRLNHPQCLQILSNHGLFLSLLPRNRNEQHNHRISQIKQVRNFRRVLPAYHYPCRYGRSSKILLH